jgi:anti-sigma regulatory factor (Ser/Thr protein kinase)
VEVTPALQQIAVRVEDPSQVGEARRRASAVAREARFDETLAGKVSLIATELATNLVKHARGGTLLLQALGSPGHFAVEVLALDSGPGMEVDRALNDGYSTSGSPGTGLGAVRRLANEFDAWSVRGQGVAVVARVWAAPPEFPLALGGVCQPYPGETACGDAWAVRPSGRAVQVLVVDGLGHGPIAARAAQAAVAEFVARDQATPERAVHAIHGALRSTRGAALAVAGVDLGAHALRFAGIGNVAGSLDSGGKPRGLVSHNGIAGHEARKIQEFTVAWERPALLVLHSDGLTSQWRLDRYAGLTARHPALVAGLLFRDHRRRTDDCTVVVLKEA